MKPKTILSLTPVIIFIIVLLQNMQDVNITFLFWNAEMPKLVLMILMTIIGVAVGWFMHMAYRRGKQNKKQANEIQSNAINTTETE